MAYSKAKATEIKSRVCRELADGKSLRTICAGKGMPVIETIRMWLLNDAAFAAQYARAREEQADFYADEIIDISDTEADPQKAKVRIDARKWVASKLKPKKYGEKIDLSHSGSIEHLRDDQLESRLADLIGKARADRAAGGTGEAEGEA